MNWISAIADLRRQLLTEIERAIARIFGFTEISATSSIGDGDQVRLSDDVPGQRPVQRIL